MTAVGIPTGTLARIQPSLAMRNDLLVGAQTQADLALHCNQAINTRTKELFRGCGAVGPLTASVIPSSLFFLGGRLRYLFAAHTGPYAKAVHWSVLCARPTVGGGDPICRFQLTNGAGAVIGTGDFHTGAFSGTPRDTLDEFVEGTGSFLVPADTDVYGAFYDVDHARLIAGEVYEQALDADTTNGYFSQQIATTSPIFANHRADMATAMSLLWRRGGAHIWNHNPSNAVTSSGADVNLLDSVSTTIGGSTPGPQFDLRYKNRQSRTSVDVVFQVYASVAGGGFGGSVKLKDQTGAVQLQVNGIGPTPQWLAVTGTLPATQAKYDCTFSTSAGTITVLAVSLYELA